MVYCTNIFDFDSTKTPMEKSTTLEYIGFRVSLLFLIYFNVTCHNLFQRPFFHLVVSWILRNTTLSSSNLSRRSSCSLCAVHYADWQKRLLFYFLVVRLDHSVSLPSFYSFINLFSSFINVHKQYSKRFLKL